MGKSCLHFKSYDDLVPDAIGKVVGALTPDQCVKIDQESRRGRK
jgi:hypothetical protein